MRPQSPAAQSADPQRVGRQPADSEIADSEIAEPEIAEPEIAEPQPAGVVAGADTAVAALEDRLRRALADLDNLRKRYERERERERLAESKRVALAWLPVLDNLDRALGYADADATAIVEGIRAVRDQALAVLAQLGFARRDEAGMPFDPARHEVVGVVNDAAAAPGAVLQVLRPGYGDGERQLRPAAVTVASHQGHQG